MKQPEISRGSGMSSQFEQQLAQQARLRDAKKLLFPVSFEQEALNMKSQGSGPLKFSPIVHPITKVPYEIPQNVSQLTRPTQRVEEMEEPSQTTENPRSRWNRLTEEQKKRSNIKRTENRQKKRMRDAQKAQEEKEKQANDALRKINCLKKLWPL